MDATDAVIWEYTDRLPSDNEVTVSGSVVLFVLLSY